MRTIHILEADDIILETDLIRPLSSESGLFKNSEWFEYKAITDVIGNCWYNRPLADFIEGHCRKYRVRYEIARRSE